MLDKTLVGLNDYEIEPRSLIVLSDGWNLTQFSHQFL